MRFYNRELNLYYETKDDTVTIVEGDHNIERADIPESIDGMTVTAIGKKTFLGCKLLKHISIPDSVTSIGDFAFAMCDHLAAVSLPQKDIKLGQSLFKNDFALREIIVRGSNHETDTAALLAAAPIQMDADYLIDIPHAGDSDWYRMWDQKLSDILGRRDDEGYHLYVLCGEEDLHFDYDQYVEYIREKKSGLCILRLLNDSFLSDAGKNHYIDFLEKHIEVEGLFPVFNYLLKSHGDDEEYFRVLIDNGIIKKSNRELLLNMMGDRHLQTKTYLINAFDEGDSDFFGDLML